MSSTLSNLSSNKQLSPPASYKEIGLIFLGCVIALVILVLIFNFFSKKNKDSSNTSSPTKISNFSQLNSDRQEEQLKRQTKISSLNTPYIRG
jgi:hypothetical protein